MFQHLRTVPEQSRHFSALHLFQTDEIYADDDTTYSALLCSYEFHSVCVLNWLDRSIWVQVTEMETLTQ
jgi:hypothetical protein